MEREEKFGEGGGKGPGVSVRLGWGCCEGSLSAKSYTAIVALDARPSTATVSLLLLKN